MVCQLFGGCELGLRDLVTFTEKTGAIKNTHNYICMNEYMKSYICGLNNKDVCDPRS